MRLFIRIKDGQPQDHPITEENFVAAFPGASIEGVPPGYALFERVPVPDVGFYEKYSHATYEWNNGVVQDVHHVVPLSAEERAQKEAFVAEAAGKTFRLYKEKAEQNLAQAANAEISDFWTSYIEKLNSWVLVDFSNPGIPVPGMAPKLSVDVPGSAPDVTG